MQITPLRTTPFFAAGLARRTSFSALVGLLGMAVFFATGCSNMSDPDPMAEAAGSGERPVAMRGGSDYFEGKIGATVTISRGFSRDISGKADSPGADRGRKRRGE